MKTRFTLFILILLSGCGGLSRPYPDKSLHALHLGAPTAADSSSGSQAVLVVNRVRIAEPYDASTFMYQVGDSKFTSDYYNGFIAPPGRLLTGELSAFLAKSGLFATVVSGDSAADYQLSLETSVTSMYGDYRDRQKAQAVVAARFFVIDQTNARFLVIFDKSYSQTTPIAQEGADALVKAYEAGWTTVLTQLADDLRKTPAVMNAGAEPAPQAPGVQKPGVK
jgi:uncharacterized lipoprotein YmbA